MDEPKRYVNYRLGAYVKQKYGRSYYPLFCECGAFKKAFPWSWAAHGHLKCPNCKGYWDYSKPNKPGE